ncbi:MAG: hypothetical protein AB8B71_02785 [Paracoccaceae bacterium]
MRISLGLLLGAGLGVLAAGSVAAEGKIYPYHAKHNYCPAGLQPVTVGGVICCGTPNQHVSYNAMLRHGATKKRRSRAADCPIGQKGCNFN